MNRDPRNSPHPVRQQTGRSENPFSFRFIPGSRGWAAVSLGLTLAILGCSQTEHIPEDPLQSARKMLQPQEATTPLPPLYSLPEDALIVYTGIFVDKVYELSLVSRTFSADGFFWLEWNSSVQDLMDLKKLSPEGLVRLSNRVEIWDSVIEPVTDAPVMLSAGRYYQRYRFSSRFYDDEIEFRRDPFGKIVLPIIIEVAPPSFSNKYADVILLPHHKQNGFMGLSGSLSGYRQSKARFEPFLHQYPTRFGSWYQPVFSQMRLEMVYQADYWSAFVTWVFPLLIIMAVVLLSPSVAGSMGDVRLAIPSTALLTLIFLQQSYHDELPPLPYLTFLDELFALGYAIALGLFALFTWGTNSYAAASEGEEEIVSRKIDRVDLIFQIVSLVVFVGVAILAWIHP
ncbi:hypothetical protein MK280_00025 [Myxococcota bacterium]|nr:hypothetical protein [Myxococcota bacterium]